MTLIMTHGLNSTRLRFKMNERVQRKSMNRSHRGPYHINTQSAKHARMLRDVDGSVLRCSASRKPTTDDVRTLSVWHCCSSSRNLRAHSRRLATITSTRVRHLRKSDTRRMHRIKIRAFVHDVSLCHRTHNSPRSRLQVAQITHVRDAMHIKSRWQRKFRCTSTSNAWNSPKCEHRENRIDVHIAGTGDLCSATVQTEPPSLTTRTPSSKATARPQQECHKRTRRKPQENCNPQTFTQEKNKHDTVRTSARVKPRSLVGSTSQMLSGQARCASKRQLRQPMADSTDQRKANTCEAFA